MSSTSSNRQQTTQFRFKNSLIRLLFVCLMWSYSDCCPAQDGTGSASGQVQQEPRLGVIHFFRPQVWGTRTVKLSNTGSEPVNLVTGGYFTGAPLNRYTRQVTIPPESERITTIRVLPTSTDDSVMEWRSLMYLADDTAGTLIRASDEFIVDAEQLPEPPEKLTAVIADFRDSDAEQIHRIVELAVATRVSMGRTRRLIQMEVEDLPVEPHGLDVVDEIVLCSNRIADDPARLTALRTWVEHGGRLWVQLDQIDAPTVTHLFGESVQLQVVDRVSLTEFQLNNVDRGQTTGDELEFDYPVDHVRMLVDGIEPLHEVNGWPASFTATIGRGRVLFTTLGNFAWVRERTDDDPPVAPEYRSEFLATQSLIELADRWMIESDPGPLDGSSFQPLLASQVGYRIPARNTILSILWLFCGALLVIGLWLRRKKQTGNQAKQADIRVEAGQKTERLAIIGPGLAFLAAVPIVFLGQSSRSSIPASVNVAEFVEVTPATSSLRSTGSAAVFVPDTEVVDLTGSQGRVLLPPADEATGTLRQMVQTDFGKSQWSDLSINTGLQFFKTYQNRPLDRPIQATVEFGPEGVHGLLQSGQFTEPQDLVIASRAPNVLALNIDAESRFTGGIDETLAPGAYVNSSMLTDQQITRQELYRSLFQVNPTSRYPREPVLLAWMRPSEAHISCPEGFTANHLSLVAVPLNYRATPPGTDVMIPSTFLTVDAVLTEQAGQSTAYDNRTASWRESLQSGQTVLRVDVPDAVKPLTLKQVNIELKLLASSHVVDVLAGQRDTMAPVATINDAAGTYRWTLTDSAQLQMDADGSYYVRLDVSPAGNGETGVESNKAWKVDFLQLELLGRTMERTTNTETVN